MTNISTTPVNFNFHGDNLLIVSLNGQPFVVMRQIVEAMGLDWASQFIKLKNNPRFCVGEITTQIAGDDQTRKMLCIPLRKLSGWLMTLHPNKVKPELREKVIAYQNECDDALWDYWNQGFAIRQSYAVNPGDVLTAAQAEQIRMALKTACEKLPKEKQAAFMTKGWSKLKSHFGVTYRKIPQHEFTEAVSMVSRHAAEWELVDEPAPVPTPEKTPAEKLMECFENGYWLLSCRNGSLTLNPIETQHRIISYEDEEKLTHVIANDVPVRFLTKVIETASKRITRILERPI